MKNRCIEVSKSWKEFPCYDFIGAGFDYATAWFGAGKNIGSNREICNAY